MLRAAARRVVQLRPAQARSGSSAHGEHHNEPAGYLFGRVPGEHAAREGWELPWFIGMYGTMLIGGIALYFKPDTRASTWAEREAERRLEATNAKF